MIKLVAFDWNGTLLADTKIAWRADNEALKALKLKPISLNRFKDCFDIPIKNYWLKVGLTEKFLKGNLKKLEIAFQKHYRSTENSAKFRANARSTLAWLRKQQILAVAYSNAPSSHVSMHIKRLKETKGFNEILGRPDADFSHLMMRGKQDRLQKYVKSKKLKPHEIISVGDTVEETQIGKHLGYHTVAITGGYNTTARLKKQRPDFLIHNMKELIGIIKKLNR
jgi:phosphoglycolate phosphatase